MAKDLLFEIGTEEMPAGFINRVREDYKNLVEEELNNNRLEFENIQVYSTPRRLTLYVENLADNQNTKKEIVRGPSEKIAFDEEKNLTRAGQGFARGQGVERDDLIIKDGYLYVEKIEEGKKTSEILNLFLPELLKKIPFPKTMQWGNYKFKFIRPIKWLLALFGEKLIKFNLTGVDSDNKSYGHRYLSKAPIEIKNPENYFSLLEDAYVIVDQEKRKDIIVKQIKAMEGDLGNVILDDELLDEVLNILEYPTAFYGRFDADYLDLPDEVLITSMVEHQKYFPITDSKGGLLPFFIGVRDGSEENIEEVRHGNELVIRARLEDARFFFTEDRKIKFSVRNEKLKNVVFQEELGSMYDKVERMKEIINKISKEAELSDEKLSNLKRAVSFCKNDLITEMVNEFPKLQGIMGREYVLLENENTQVASAIAEHYLPRYSGDKLPESKEGQILSIVDKIDNIAGHFSLGLIPSGSTDPFALRRQASGIVSILVEKDIKINLSSLISKSLESLDIRDAKLEDEIKSFILQRMHNFLEERGIRYDVINSVITLDNDDLFDIYLRSKAIMELRKENTELFINLFRGLVRAKNLGSKLKGNTVIDSDKFETDYESDLYGYYLEYQKEIRECFANKEYIQGLKIFANFKEPIDNFLDNVIVMVDDEEIRNNRLSLLRQISSLLENALNTNEIALD